MWVFLNAYCTLKLIVLKIAEKQLFKAFHNAERKILVFVFCGFAILHFGVQCFWVKKDNAMFALRARDLRQACKFCEAYECTLVVFFWL